jgi:hypothetical protein
VKNLFRRNPVKAHGDCPVCGRSHGGRSGIIQLTGKALLEVAIAVLMLFGILFAFTVLHSPVFLLLPIVVSTSFHYTEIASQYHPEVQEIADDIVEQCGWMSVYSDDYFNCLLDSSIDYMTSNFEYENDWEMGRPNGHVSENMILSHRKKGDCIDFSITFCSLMKHMDISCIVRSPNGAHRIALAKWDDAWIPIEPQNGKRGRIDDDLFKGFLI